MEDSEPFLNQIQEEGDQEIFLWSGELQWLHHEKGLESRGSIKDSGLSRS